MIDCGQGYLIRSLQSRNTRALQYIGPAILQQSMQLVIAPAHIDCTLCLLNQKNISIRSAIMKIISNMKFGTA
ncbi:MAG: hypothetical protein EZS28_010260 [Streblomastix strix]|uniref:Uncharacterized protein n=1 Tax=Streblomastix strix TaxID=222440 RepID=A0A5J4WH26_9EUKA|nr:MAG: hypothetical protein EZS28_010260 [Streblomastix strix]